MMAYGTPFGRQMALGRTLGVMYNMSFLSSKLAFRTAIDDFLFSNGFIGDTKECAASL